MALNIITRFVLVPFMVSISSFQCSNGREDPAANKCDCQTASIAEQKKNVEAVVVYFQGGNPESIPRPDVYVLSTDSADFERSSHVAGPNILVPCDSLPFEYRKQGLRLLVSYMRKDCYGAITQPNFFGNYGYFVDLTAIKAKN